MKTFLKILLASLLFLPATALATTAVPWSITNLTDGFIFPNLVNGSAKGILVSASSTFNGNLSVSTLTNGDCVQAGVGGILVSASSACGSGGSTPGGLNLQVQYNNAGAFGGISGAVTNGTILNLTNPLLGGATLTTSVVNGVTLTSAGSATSYLNGTGAYSVPVGTTYTATYPVLVTGTVISTALSSSTLTASSPLTGSFAQVGTGGSLGIQVANTSQNGYLSSTDWNTFNNKQPAGNYATFGYLFPNNATTSALTLGGLTVSGIGAGTVNANSAGGFYTSATTTVSCTGNATCSPFTVFGASPFTINVAAGTAASSTLLGDSNTFSGNNTFTQLITGSISGNAGTATKLATGRTISITGDLAYTSPSFDGSGNVTAAGTLATVNSNVGTFTYPSVTVNGKGLVTAISNGTAPTTYTGTAPIFVSGSTIGTSFSTSTFNAFTAENTFTSLFATNASSTNATTTNLALVGAAANCNGTSALTTNSSGVVGCTAQPQGTVTAVSVASANGFAGSSSGGATPALTLSTTITGLLKGNGTAITAATPGTDYDVFGYPFPNNATSTTIAFGNGLISGASTTLSYLAGNAAGKFLAVDPTGKIIATTTPSGGGSTSPGGANTDVQFNNSGAFGGVADFAFDKTTDQLTLGSTTPGAGSSIKIPDVVSLVDANGNDFTLFGSNGVGVGARGGGVRLQAGNSGLGDGGDGGEIDIIGGSAAGTNGDGGDIILSGGNSTGTGSNGGTAILNADETAGFFVGANILGSPVQIPAIWGGAALAGLDASLVTSDATLQFPAGISGTTDTFCFQTLGNCSSGGSAYPFPLTGNATSTLTQFNGGLTAYASSTIGNGLAGLTVSGNATTTGNAFISGNLGLGTSTPFAKFAIQANANDTNTNLFAIGSSTASTNTTLFSIGNNGQLVAVASSTPAPPGSLQAGFSFNPSLNLGSMTPGAVVISGQLTTFTVNGTTGTFTAGGHVIGDLTHTLINESGVVTLPMIVGAESAVENDNANTTLSLVYGSLVHMNNNQGTMSAFDAFSSILSSGENAGTISAYTDFHCQDFSAVTGVPTNRFCIANNDPSKKIYTAGNVGIGILPDTSKLYVSGGVSQFENGGVDTNGTDLEFGTAVAPNNFLHTLSTSHSVSNAANNSMSINLSGTSGATQSVTAFKIQGNNTAGFGTTSPFATLSVQANNGDTHTTLFAIGSSTATANSTLFSVSNTGSIFTVLANGCLQAASGFITSTGSACGAGSSAFAFPWTPTTNFGVNTNATSTPISFFKGIFASSTSVIASTTFAINGNVGISTSSPSAQLTLASKISADQTPAFVIDGATGSFNADMQLNRGSNTGTEEANIDFATAGTVNYQLGIQNNSTSDFELWDGSNDPVFTVKSGTNSIGFGTSTPFGDFAINADFGDAPGLIFNVASSSQSGTTSVFAINSNGYVMIGTTTPTVGTATFAEVISNSVRSLGGLAINTWTNVTNAFSIINAAGTTVFNVDTTATNPFLGVGTTTPWATVSVVGDGTDPAFAVSTSTSNNVLPNFEIDQNGHVVTSGPKPTCTTSCTFGQGNDNAFRVTSGTAVTSEVITFAKSWGTNAPICQATEGNNTAVPILVAASSTPTTVTLTNAALTTRDIDVICEGIQ